MQPVDHWKSEYGWTHDADKTIGIISDERKETSLHAEVTWRLKLEKQGQIHIQSLVLLIILWRSACDITWLYLLLHMVSFLPPLPDSWASAEQDSPAGGLLGCSLRSHRPVTASLCEDERIQRDKVGAGYVLRRLIRDGRMSRVWKSADGSSSDLSEGARTHWAVRACGYRSDLGFNMHVATSVRVLHTPYITLPYYPHL